MNAYDDFLGKLSTNKNTEGSSFNNPIDVAKEITKGDMGQLQNTVNSSEYKKLVSQLKTASQSEIPKIKTKLEGMITNTIHANFGLDNFLHNNVKVDVNHLLETGRTRLTKQYTFKPGSSVATAEKNPFFVAIADITGMPLDTWGAASIPDWMTIPGPSLIGLPVVLAQTFAPAIAAKVGLGNAEKHGGAYAAPGMYMELEIPEGQLDAKQENQPSTEEKKNNLSNLIGFGDEEEGKITSAGETLSDGEMKSLEKMGLTPAQIKRVMDAGGANDLKDLAAGGVEAYEYRDVETQSDVDWSDPKMVDYYMNNVFDDKPVPHDDTLLKLMLSATQGGKVLNALGGIINAIGKWWNEGKTFGPKGEEGWSWNKLLQDDWLKKQLNDKTGKWNPFRSLYVWAKDKGGMLSGPTPMTREFFRRLGPMGAQLLEKIKQIGFDENVKPAIEKMSTSELNTRVNEIWDKDPKGVEKIYTPLVEKDPTYQKYNSLWQEEDKIRTDYKQYGQDEYNLEWKLYRAEQEVGKAYYGVTSNWDDTVPGWQGTGDNKGYSDSILGRGDAAQKALDEFKYQPSVWKGDKLVSGGGSWDEKTQWDRSPYSYANYQKIEKAWSDSYPVETKGKDSNASAKMSDAKDKSFVKLYNKVKSAFGIDPQTVSRGTKVPSPVNDVISQWNSMWSKYDSALKAWQNENDKLNTWNKKEINRLQGEVDRLDKEAENYRQTHMNPLWDAQRKARELGKEIADIDLESTFDKIGREVLTQWEFAHLEDEWKDGKYKDEEFKIDGAQVAGVNYDLDNWIDKTYGSGASNWYRQSDGKTEGNPFIPAGSYIPKASIKDIEYKKKLKAYSIDEPIVATTSQSKKKRKRTQVAHYQPQGTMIKETTFSRIKKMRKKFDYEGKPSPDGFPDNEPPKLDPKTGMHPNYGKNASRYKKLDPVSARAMPKTGDPETDAEVAKAAKKPK